MTPTTHFRQRQSRTSPSLPGICPHTVASPQTQPFQKQILSLCPRHFPSPGPLSTAALLPLYSLAAHPSAPTGTSGASLTRLPPELSCPLRPVGPHGPCVLPRKRRLSPPTAPLGLQLPVSLPVRSSLPFSGPIGSVFSRNRRLVVGCFVAFPPGGAWAHTCGVQGRPRLSPFCRDGAPERLQSWYVSASPHFSPSNKIQKAPQGPGPGSGTPTWGRNGLVSTPHLQPSTAITG